MRKLRAFTLVELLVVIGIIAVLISILLPSLARARMSAITLQCQTNLRSVGQGLLLYANDHGGKLPFSGNGDWSDIWPAQVTSYLGGTAERDPNDANGMTGASRYAPVLRCPEAYQIDDQALVWWGGFHYTANCRAMPQWHDLRDGTSTCKPYPLATQNSAEKMLLWDGPISDRFGGSAPTNNMPQWYYFMTWGGRTGGWTDPDIFGQDLNGVLSPGIDMYYTSSKAGDWNYMGKINRDMIGYNPWDWVTGDTSWAWQRYRHMANTQCNVLFFDGHVEPRNLGEIHLRDVALYRY